MTAGTEETDRAAHRHGDVAPGAAGERDRATEGFVLNQTMLRIRDPQASLDFYTRILGMTLLRRIEVPAGRFTLYFLGLPHASALDAMPADEKARTEWLFAQPALLELTHNWGTENDPEAGYHDGNSEPRGFGHIGIAVPDVYEACARFEALGVEFVKRPDDGMMKGLAFILDPDGYWVEILAPRRMADLTAS
jgi:lactoylglutathione lyase